MSPFWTEILHLLDEQCDVVEPLALELDMQCRSQAEAWLERYNREAGPVCLEWVLHQQWPPAAPAVMFVVMLRLVWARELASLMQSAPLADTPDREATLEWLLLSCWDQLGFATYVQSLPATSDAEYSDSPPVFPKDPPAWLQ